MKTQPVSGFAVIARVIESAFARRRIAANYLGIILVHFVKDLLARGYARTGIRVHVEVAEHFGRWLKHRGVPLRRLSTWHVHQFLRYHLPRCRCPKPAPKARRHCGVAMGRLVEFLRDQKRIKEFKPKTPPQGPVNQLIALWLGHASPATTHLYIEADLAMKEQALQKVQPPRTKRVRFQPRDALLRFLDHI